MIHDLKCWPEFFESVLRGDKRFDARKNDRDFKLGDALRLREFDPPVPDCTGEFTGYTGRVIECKVTYILYGNSNPIHGIPDGVCVMSIQPTAMEQFI